MALERNDNQREEVRIGFFICHCGTNIAGMIDVADVAEYCTKLPNVFVSREYKYLCSEPGQELIANDIKEHRLNRVVVSACSPLLHEMTFRTATLRGGINPFFCHMINIREHGSWVHTDRASATEKAKAMARGAIARVKYHKPLEKRRAPVTPSALILGGGIAGITAALNLAKSGKKVYLVEREPTIGGHMAQFDKTFPTLDCAACILTPKMSEVYAHPNIELRTYCEVAGFEGYVGNYKAKILHKPRYIDEELCVGCMDCVDACVFKIGNVDDEFNVGLSKRKPVYMPFPQATPKLVVIDPKACTHLMGNKCKQECIESCERAAINFDQKEWIEDVEVGTVIVATGFKPHDAREEYMPNGTKHTLKKSYGYGKFPNVYTALEVERLVTSSGPTEGHVVLRDGTKPKAVGIIHCVGSRDHNTNRWCSRVCCMYSLKLAHLIQEHTSAEVYNFYIDMRTAGKGYEEFYERLLEEGINAIRGRVAEVSDVPVTPEEEGRLVIRVEDSLAGFVRRIPVDMVVLATGLEPQPDAQDVRRMFNISCSTEGFFLERHPKLAPVATNTDGVFIAGCCHGPKDIPDSVAQAGAAAAECMMLIDKGYVEMEPMTSFVQEEFCSGCKTCLNMCPYNAITRDDAKGVAVINAVLCKGCGVCVSACPSGAITQNLFEDEEIFSEIREMLAHV
jgi:heterodisulfide reductase subunit A